jgi:CubicO group peptidase (beta-lactamase class C family)
MSELKVEIDPAEAGFAKDRLRRLDENFARYTDDGRLKGWLLTVSRHGKLVHVASHGQRDAEAGLPVEPDTLWRIYSMTKPVTSVAAMMLYEQGAFELTDPVSKFIPSFKDMRVFTGGSDQRPVTVPATEPVRIWHLLTHTSGLTYGFHRMHPVDAMYRAAGFDLGLRPGTLAESCDIWASLPLLFQPGSEWNYSVATDVLGRVVEVASGQPLDEFFAQRIFGPLGMTDTAFYAAPEDLGRLAALYARNTEGKAGRFNSIAEEVRKPPVMLSGGGGLVSTAADYNRFLHMLLPWAGRRLGQHSADSPAGELDGARLLSSRTVAYMSRNHLPGNRDIEQFGRPINAESPQRGVGFGLGFAVVIDPAAGKVVVSDGELSWGGAASTAFWIDPAEELVATFFTQLIPSSAHPIRSQFRQLVYQALV